MDLWQATREFVKLVNTQIDEAEEHADEACAPQGLNSHAQEVVDGLVALVLDRSWDVVGLFPTRFKSYKSTIIIVICCRIIVVIVLKTSASRVVTVRHNYNCDNCADKCGNCADNCGNCDDNCDNCDMR